MPNKDAKAKYSVPTLNKTKNWLLGSLEKKGMNCKQDTEIFKKFVK